MDGPGDADTPAPTTPRSSPQPWHVPCQEIRYNSCCRWPTTSRSGMTLKRLCNTVDKPPLARSRTPLHRNALQASRSGREHRLPRPGNGGRTQLTTRHPIAVETSGLRSTRTAPGHAQAKPTQHRTQGPRSFARSSISQLQRAHPSHDADTQAPHRSRPPAGPLSEKREFSQPTL